MAVLISVPLYLAALLTASLALDKPRLVGTRERPPTSSTEATVWAVALIVPAILVAAGVVALAFGRFGLYLSSGVGVVLCFVVPSLAHGWIGRHERRFPLGMDFVKDSSASNLSSRGEWEHAAYDTIVSITHWTLVLAFGAIAIGILLEVRRRRGADAIPVARTGEPTGGASTLTGSS